MLNLDPGSKIPDRTPGTGTSHKTYQEGIEMASNPLLQRSDSKDSALHASSSPVERILKVSFYQLY